MNTDWINFRAHIDANKIAIVNPISGEEYSYGQINDIAKKGASYFQSLGYQKGDKVAVLAKNCVEYIYLFSIAQKLGLVLVPLNYRLTEIELSQLLDQIQPRILLYQEGMDYLIPSIESKREINGFFSQVIQDGSDVFRPETIEDEDVILMLFTSGSSGIPKAVLYTYKMMFWNSVNTMCSLRLTSQTSTIVCMPPFHTGGWNVLLTPLLHLGGKVILVEKFDAPQILSLLEKYECSIFMGVPTMLKMMSEDTFFDSCDLSFLDYIIVGGEAMPLNVINQYHSRGIFIRQGYGMTEAGPNLTSLHEKDAIRKIGSIGKPNMYVKVKIINDRGEEVKANERGQLLIGGPIVFKEYFNNKKETDKAIIDGWVHTGDIAIVDKEGFIYIVDRIKNMFISGGENVYPLEIERTLIQHPKIEETIVIGVPDEKWGETGCAIVKLKEGERLTIDELQDFCCGKLSRYKIPKTMIISKEFHKTETGKIDRKRMRLQFG